MTRSVNQSWWWGLPVLTGVLLAWSIGHLADRGADAVAAETEARAAEAIAATILELDRNPGTPAEDRDIARLERRLAGRVQRVAESAGLDAESIRSIELSRDGTLGRLRVDFSRVGVPRLAAFLEGWRVAEPRVRVDRLVLDASESRDDGQWSVEVNFAY
ncbi:MAG: GspMb/PilO family protein [Planctomycetota bacterium]